MTNPGRQGAAQAAHAQHIHRRDSRSKTGVVGISLAIKRRAIRKGAPRTFFVVSPHRREFCIETLGRAEAFRRAVALRAAHERALAARKGAAR